MPNIFKQKNSVPRQQNHAKEKLSDQKKQPIVKKNVTDQEGLTESDKIAYNALKQASPEAAGAIVMAKISVDVAKKRRELDDTLKVDTKEGLPGALRDIANNKGGAKIIPATKKLLDELSKSNMGLKDAVLNTVKKDLESIIIANDKASLAKKSLHKLADTIEIISEIEQIKIIAEQLPEQYGIRERANKILKETEALLELDRHSDSNLIEISNKLKIIKKLKESKEIVENLNTLKAGIVSLPIQEEVQKHATDILKDMEELLDKLGSDSTKLHTDLVKISKKLKSIEALEQSKVIPVLAQNLAILQQEINRLPNNNNISLDALKQSVVELIQKERSKLNSDDPKIIEKINSSDVKEIDEVTRKLALINETIAKLQSLKIDIVTLPIQEDVQKHATNNLRDAERLLSKLSISNIKFDDELSEINKKLKNIEALKQSRVIPNLAKNLNLLRQINEPSDIDIPLGALKQSVAELIQKERSKLDSDDPGIIEKIDVSDLEETNETIKKLNTINQIIVKFRSLKIDIAELPDKQGVHAYLENCLNNTELLFTKLDIDNFDGKLPSINDSIVAITSMLSEAKITKNSSISDIAEMDESIGLLETYTQNVQIIIEQINQKLSENNEVTDELVILQEAISKTTSEVLLLARPQSILAERIKKIEVLEKQLDTLSADQLVSAAVILFNESKTAIDQLIEWNSSPDKSLEKLKPLVIEQLKKELTQANQQFSKGNKIIDGAKRINNSLHTALKVKNKEVILGKLGNNYYEAVSVLNNMNTELRDLRSQINSYKKNWRYCFSYIFSLGGIDKKLTQAQQQIEANLRKSSEKIKNIGSLQRERYPYACDLDLKDLDKANTSKQEAAALGEKIESEMKAIKENLKTQSSFFKKF